jgi:hypothetical protein
VCAKCSKKAGSLASFRDRICFTPLNKVNVVLVVCRLNPKDDSPSYEFKPLSLLQPDYLSSFNP